jgi:hypothetical protein
MSQKEIKKLFHECKINLVFKNGRFRLVDKNGKEVEVKKYE